MKRGSVLFITLSLFLLPPSSFSQDTIKVFTFKHYDDGVAAMNRKEYAKADSFFTLALRSGDDGKDVYFNRAIARKKLGDNCGYCVDLACAAEGYACRKPDA